MSGYSLHLRAVTLYRVDEKIDALNERGEPTGEVVWKSEAHRRGIRHRCFHCWVSGADGAGPYLVVQRRAAAKSTWPGRLDVSAAGHIGAGERVIDGGLRELDEELGLKARPEDLTPLGTRKIDQEIPRGRDREFHEVFLLLDDTPPEDLRLQREEVESVLRVSLDDVERLAAGETVSVREWTADGPVSARITLEDFVPNEDQYLVRVAGAARRIHAGEAPGYLYGG